MYQRIMVPLDGSELAECVLPHVESIVKGCNTPNVVLIRVVEPVHLPVGSGSYEGMTFTEQEAAGIRKETDLRNQSDAQIYIKEVSDRMKYVGLNLQSEVLMGKPAETLAEYAEKNGVDLIIIATHGRSGISRWVWGSVADKVLRSACMPILMIRAPGCVPGI